MRFSLAIYFLFFFLLSITKGHSQSKAGYDYFNRSPLGLLTIKVPKPFSFQPITIQHPQIGNNFTNPSQFYTSPEIEQQNQIIMQQPGMPVQGAHNARQVTKFADIERELMQEKLYKDQIEWLNKTDVYRQAYRRLLLLNPDSFSITEAVFIVESAWLDNKYKLEEFQKRLKLEAEIIRQLLKREKLNVRDDMALNYGIQKRFRHSTPFYDSKKKQMMTARPFQYDFNDIRGEKGYANLFVTKLMITGKGQCHSMPLMYLMIAEQLGTKAWLSLAPQHSFIQFKDKHGNMLNFETTNGNLVSNNWLIQSGYVNANALKSGTYLDTLSHRQLFAQCLADLLMGYMQKFGYDRFSEQMRQKILQLHPNNLTATIIEANVRTEDARHAVTAAGKPKEEDLAQYPEAFIAFQAMLKAYDKVDGLGYQDMPKEAYQLWLQSFEQEKKKQENKEIQERLRREIEHMKKNKPKTVITNHSRG